MKFIAIVTLALGLSLSSCTSEAKTGAGNAASALGDAATKALDGLKAQLPGSLNGVKDVLAKITSVDLAKTAGASLSPLIDGVTKMFSTAGAANLGDLAKKFGGSLPTEITGAADGVTKEVTRLSGNADIKGALGGVLDQITNLLKK